MIAINPYINFSGNCEEAFRFYQGIFGGELVNLMYFEQLEGHKVAPEDAKRVVHVALPVGKQLLMGSDMPTAFGAAERGNAMSISIHVSQEDEARRFFDGLKVEGNVIMPLEKTFWSPLFGMVTDRFGVHWMISYDPDYLNEK